MAQAAPGATPGLLDTLPMLAFPILIFYLLLFRPQAKIRKQHEQMLKNVKKYDEAARLLDEQIRTHPRNDYAYICRARLKAAQSAYDAAMSDLDTAWSISTARGGSGDNRVPLTRAMLVVQAYEGSGDSQHLVEAERILREAMPSVPPGFRPRFRNLLTHVHWYRAQWGDAYQDACQSVAENSYEERNFQYKAFASLATYKWDDAQRAAERGLALAGQLILPRLLCGAALTIAASFAGVGASEIDALHSRWLSELATAPEWRPDGFKWRPIQARIAALLSSHRQPQNVAIRVVEDVLRLITATA